MRITRDSFKNNRIIDVCGLKKTGGYSYLKGITLVELVAFIVIMGIASVSMVAILTTITEKVKFSEDTVSASFYAEQLMERVAAQGYTNVTNYSITATASPDGFAKSVVVRYGNVTGSQWVITDDSNDPYKVVNVTVTQPVSGGGASLSAVLISY